MLSVKLPTVSTNLWRLVGRFSPPREVDSLDYRAFIDFRRGNTLEGFTGTPALQGTHDSAITFP